MQQLKTQLQNGVSSFGRARRYARNAVLAGSVSLVAAGQAFAAAIPISIDGVEEQITAGGTSAGTVAGYVALALAVLACAGVIFGMLRKA